MRCESTNSQKELAVGIFVFIGSIPEEKGFFCSSVGLVGIMKCPFSWRIRDGFVDI